MPTATLEFIGTATSLIRLGGFTLLTDPNFLHRGQRAYLGKGLFSKRLTEPAMGPDDLPPIDAIILSHMHGDHFDRVARKHLPRDLPIITTPHAADKLYSWRFEGATALRTWDSVPLTHGEESLLVHSAPGEHTPGWAPRLLPPVMGSVLEYRATASSEPFRVYITGDTLYRPWLREVADRFGRLDAMVIHLGGTRVLGMLVTMDDEQGASLVDLLEPVVTVPVHVDDYTVFRSPLSNFVDRWQHGGLPGQLRLVERGQTVSLSA